MLGKLLASQGGGHGLVRPFALFHGRAFQGLRRPPPPFRVRGEMAYGCPELESISFAPLASSWLGACPTRSPPSGVFMLSK